MRKGPSYAGVACTCPPESRLSLEQVATELGFTVDQTIALVEEKLLWMAEAKGPEKGQESRKFCPKAIESIRADPALVANLRKTLTRLRRRA